MKKHMGRVLSLAMAVLMLAGMALPCAPIKTLTADAATTKIVKIACIGASTTAGAGSNDGTSWPSDLQQLVGGLCEVRNFGVNSRTVLHDGVEWNDTDRKTNLAYTKTSEYKSSIAYKPDIVLIMLGGNDAKPINWRDGNNTFKEDYKKLVESYQTANPDAQVVVVIEPWIRNNGAFTITEEVMASGVRPAYTEVAKEMGLPTIDLYTATKDHNEWYSDNVHANSAGYQAMAEAIYAQMKTLNLIPEGSENVPSRPVASIGDFYGEFDGYEVMQWKKGTTGNFNYASGTIASQLGIAKNTVVQNLTINVSYYYDCSATSNGDWWHFNTTDKTGQSAPNICKSNTTPNPHDNGFGHLLEDYALIRNKWSVLTVSRDEQKLGGSGSDWYVNVGELAKKNSLYFRGFEVKATLTDGTVKTMTWGTMRDRRGADDGKTLKIACVGASTTTGNQVASDKGTSYPKFLKEMIGDNCKVGNYGLPGGTATRRTDGFPQLSYLDSSNHKNSLKMKADVVIIDLGVNDSQTGVWNMGTFARDYEELVKSYLDQGNDPLVLLSIGGHCTMNTWDTTDWRIEKNIMPIQLAVAEKYNLPTVNLRALLMSDPDAYICKEDGVHYTDVGYKAMAQLFYDKLMELVDIPQADKTALEAAIKDEVTDFSGYTEESAKAYTEALAAAKTVFETANNSQAKVDAALKALTDAKAALKPLIDRTALEAAIADEVTDLTPYTDESAKAYTEALIAAKAAAAKADATQEEIDAATKALTDAKAALTAKPTVVYGDVNGDKVVDTADAVLVLQRAAKLIGDDNIEMDAADVNGDKVVDTADAVLILQKAAKLIEKFPVED